TCPIINFILLPSYGFIVLTSNFIKYFSGFSTASAGRFLLVERASSFPPIHSVQAHAPIFFVIRVKFPLIANGSVPGTTFVSPHQPDQGSLCIKRFLLSRNQNSDSVSPKLVLTVIGPGWAPAGTLTLISWSLKFSTCPSTSPVKVTIRGA